MHKCHWPGCQMDVSPDMWGCKSHWFRLPKNLRDRVWDSYRPGQEITKRVTPEYLEVAKDIQKWIADREGR